MSRTRGGGRHLDEDDIRVRARGGSRPRTRTRPKHENAVEGLVTAVDRGRYRCLVEGARVVAMKARELGRGSIVVGDRVDVVGDLSGLPDTLARIVRVKDRSSVLRRTADDTDPVERIIVANADQLAIVCALADPAPQPRFVDRCLVAAYDAGLSPLLCLTKADLADPGGLLQVYEPLGVPYEVLSPEGDLTGLEGRLAGRTTVLVGSSGVGWFYAFEAIAVYAGMLTSRPAVVIEAEHPFFIWLHPEQMIDLSDADVPLSYLLADGAEILGLPDIDPFRCVVRLTDSIQALVGVLGAGAYTFLGEIARLTQPARAE
jgi:hypothetical protein